MWTKIRALCNLTPSFPKILIFGSVFIRVSKSVENKVRAIFIRSAPIDAALSPVERKLDEITRLPQNSPIFPQFSPNLTPKQLQGKESSSIPYDSSRHSKFLLMFIFVPRTPEIFFTPASAKNHNLGLFKVSLKMPILRHQVKIVYTNLDISTTYSTVSWTKIRAPSTLTPIFPNTVILWTVLYKRASEIKLDQFS